MFYQRRKVALCFINLVAILMSIFCIGCLKIDLPPIKQLEVHQDFSVNYIDVGQGDCIFIRLPDGKNLLIDCGVNDVQNENSDYIINVLNQYSVTTIDYFILTHPDLDHIGNAKDIINNFAIGKLYTPFISNTLLNSFQDFQQVLDLVEQKQIERIISDYTRFILGDNYTLAFLSPASIGHQDSSYAQLESSVYPTDRQINDLSPIIYFECFEKRFVFTGDASSTQEQIVINNYEVGAYDALFKDYEITINIEEIDYLKVSHHGADDATCQDFLSLLKPKNFIVSVGKENFYGHPRSEVLERILTVCPESKLYRTDEVGTITIYKNNFNQMVISTTK